MRTVVCSDGLIVTYCEAEEKYADAIASSDYVIARCASFEETSRRITSQGFSFLNRAIGMKYVLKKENDLHNHYSSDIQYAITDKWDVDEVFSIAKNYFQRDSRFALDHFEDTHRKDELLRNYIEYLLNKKTAQAQHLCAFNEGGAAA